jgi:hypothetical protein
MTGLLPPPGRHFHFVDVAVKHLSAMVHPFDVELGDDGRL